MKRLAFAIISYLRHVVSHSGTILFYYKRHQYYRNVFLFRSIIYALNPIVNVLTLLLTVSVFTVIKLCLYMSVHKINKYTVVLLLLHFSFYIFLRIFHNFKCFFLFHSTPSPPPTNTLLFTMYDVYCSFTVIISVREYSYHRK